MSQDTEHDKLIRLIEHHPDDFAVPPTATENYVLIEVSMFSGRSLDTKRALYQNIVMRFAALGVASHDIRIVLSDVPRENWGIRGGIPASEIDLGFQVEI